MTNKELFQAGAMVSAGVAATSATVGIGIYAFNRGYEFVAGFFAKKNEAPAPAPQQVAAATEPAPQTKEEKKEKKAK